MYCPQCATQNPDGVRFCRSCGMELEAVALALRDQPTQSSGVTRKKSEVEEWLEKRSKGIKKISTGISLLIVSVLIGVAMAFFVPSHIPWIVVWAIFVGWMAMMGAVELGNGIAGMLEAKNRLRMLGLPDLECAVRAELSSADHTRMISKPSPALRSSPQSSVTEETTRQLDDLVEK